VIDLLPWLLLAWVAFGAWPRRTAPGPSALPPLVPPLGPVTVAPLATPAAPSRGASGPHPLTLLSILGAGAMISWALASRPAPEVRPDDPPPVVPAGWPTLDLRGAFVGDTAAEDAMTTHYLLRWLAEQIRYDGSRPEPILRTAAAFDDLRKVAREGRMEGGTLGQRQPLARERIKAFLDSAVGDSGGPVDAAGREKFIRAFRDVSRAAAVAIGRKPE
jgi:hypothetical protein